ncbi:MAG TPA: tyrosine-type recombinase/integrase [Bryobacteraceae bacterium]|nr:tyrosine-type recombinase/integrase [Bryobacteraceae bacterium]
MEQPPPISRKASQIGELYSTFQMDRLVKNVSVKTLELYETAWKFFGPEWDHQKLNLKTKGEAREREELRLLESCKISIAKAKLSGRKLSAVSQNIYIRVANTFFNFLHEEDIFKAKLKLAFIEQPTGDRREIFRDEEVIKFQAFKPRTFNQRRVHTIGLTMLDSGVRIAEALNLTPDDVIWESSLLKIVGKGNKTRYVPISSGFRAILYRYMRTVAPDFVYVFGCHTGTQMIQENASRDLRVVEKKCKIRSLSFHSFRHTFATGYLRRGGDIYKLQQILGHADLKTTSVYLHLMAEYVAKGHDAVSSLTPMRKTG